MNKDRATSAMGSGKKKSKPRAKKGGKHVHEMHIRHAANGGYIVKHHFKPVAGGGGMQEPEEHAIPDVQGLADHVQENMQTPPPQAQPQPQPGAQPGV